MGKFTGILNCKNYYGGQEGIRFNKASKIYDLVKWKNFRSKWYSEKYWQYSKKQANLFIYEKKAYASDRDWNVGRRVKQRTVTLFPWKEN
jgi:hypothetical protein